MSITDLDINLVEEENIKQRAILVGLNKNIRNEISIEDSMQELAELADAAGAEVLQVIVQSKATVTARFYIGSGKVEEIKYACEVEGANLVIFNDELSGSQIRNLEEVINVKVIDRTTLILDIFAQRAKTKVAKLQVELAQHRYRLPRLTGLGESLSRTGAGIGARGPGEQKLEIDRRHIRDRITDIGRQLDEVKKNREVQRSKRKQSEMPIVALVGYTNAGKSTVMNHLLARDESKSEEKLVFEKDMLFATLDTSNRSISLEDKKEFILIDTVGFVSKLPHALVQAFKATLEEVTEADLLLHIVDGSNENFRMQIEVTEGVLKELGVNERDSIIVFNKIDLIEGENTLPRGEGYRHISALKEIGLDDLINDIRKSVFSDFTKVSMQIPFTKGDIYSYLCSNYEVEETEYNETGTFLVVELDKTAYNKYKEYIVEEL